MRAFDFDLLGCPVTDYASGEVLGSVKVVLRSPTPGRIAQLVMARGEPSGRAAAGRESHGGRGALAAGEALYDARGLFAGWTVGVAEGMLRGGVKVDLDEGLPDGACFLLVRQPSRGEEAVLDGLEPLDGEGAFGDYMVGQVAACTLLDGAGQVLVRAGDLITVATLERARAQGLLHRLEARF